MARFFTDELQSQCELAQNALGVGRAAEEIAASMRKSQRIADEFRSQCELAQIALGVGSAAEEFAASMRESQRITDEFRSQYELAQKALGVGSAAEEFADQFRLNAKSGQKAFEIDRYITPPADSGQETQELDRNSSCDDSFEPLYSVHERVTTPIVGPSEEQFAAVVDALGAVFQIAGIKPYFLRVWSEIITSPSATPQEIDEANNSLFVALQKVVDDSDTGPETA
jgi:hypothetical protein